MSLPFRSQIKRWTTFLRVRTRGFVHSEPEVPFLIIGEARTGTNFLADLLRSHPEISVAGEILNPYNPEGIRTRFRTRTGVIRHIKYSLRALKGKCRGAQTHIYHFQLHGLPMETLVRTIPTLRFILIYRQSLAEQFVSWKLATLSGRWVGTSDSAVHKNTISLDVHEFRRWCDAVRQRYAELSRCRSIWERSVLLTYEELCSSPQQVMSQKVFPFLEVKPVLVKTRLRKQNPRPLKQCIENYAEIGDLLEREILEVARSS